MKPGCKVSPSQRHQLVQIYLHMGPSVAEPMCRELGLAARYAETQVRELGWHEKKKFTGGGDIAMTTDHSDPRWERARAIGRVTV